MLIFIVSNYTVIYNKTRVSKDNYQERISIKQSHDFTTVQKELIV